MELEEKQTNNVIRTRIVELEDKLIDFIESSIKYEDSPILFF